MQPRSGLVQSTDAQIFYREYPFPHPHAQTLILLHGNGEDHRYFDRQIAAFSARFRLVLMDTRGQGRSSAGRGKLNFSVFAQDLLRLMDALHIPKAHLLGFSDGGNLALTFALAYPQRVLSLILNGANLEPNGMRPSVQLPVVAEYHLCRLLSPFSQGFRQKQQILGLMVNHPHISAHQLAALTMPALVIVGQHDMIRHQHSLLIAHSLPRSRFVCLAGADHFCAAKQPEAFNREVLSFFILPVNRLVLNPPLSA